MTEPKMTQKTSDIGQQFRTASLIILGICGLLALLVYGRGFLVPLVIAALLTSLISAGISKLEKRGLPTWAAMTVSISVFFVLIYGFAQIFSSQVDVVSQTLPKYSERFDRLLDDLTALLGKSQVEQISAHLTNMDFSGHAASIAESVGGLFGNLGLILMYSAFLLAERGKLMKKFTYLFPDPDRASEVQGVLRSVGHSIKRYVWIKTIVSLLTGTLCYLILKYIGVDFAEILSLLIFLLNFIPTIGSILGVIFPAVVSLLQFDTITPFLMVVALCGSVQFTVGNIIEPKFMGDTLNLSTFTVVVSLTFWSTVWGVEGAFMSVPMTASLVILCRDIPALRPFAIVLSSDGDVDKGRSPGQKPTNEHVDTDSKTLRKIESLQEELRQIREETNN